MAEGGKALPTAGRGRGAGSAPRHGHRGAALSGGRWGRAGGRGASSGGRSKAEAGQGRAGQAGAGQGGRRGLLARGAAPAGCRRPVPRGYLPPRRAPLARVPARPEVTRSLSALPRKLEQLLSSDPKNSPSAALVSRRPPALWERPPAVPAPSRGRCSGGTEKESARPDASREIVRRGAGGGRGRGTGVEGGRGPPPLPARRNVRRY